MKIRQNFNRATARSTSSSKPVKLSNSAAKRETRDHFSPSKDEQTTDSKLKEFAARAGDRLKEGATEAFFWTSMAALTVTMGAIPGAGAMVAFANSETGGSGDFLRVAGGLANVMGTVSMVGQGNPATTLGILGLSGGLIACSFLLD